MARKDRRFIERMKSKAERERPSMVFDFPPSSLLGMGPVIETDIGITDVYAEALKKEGKVIPDKVRCRLLIDTGADLCMVRHDVAEKAGLKMISAEAPIQGVGVDTSGRSYLGRVWFGCQSKKITGIAHQIWVDTEIASGDFNFDHMDGVIGRDVLQFFDFCYYGKSGRVTMKYLRPKKVT